jgi:hypothetical protein
MVIQGSTTFSAKRLPLLVLTDPRSLEYKLSPRELSLSIGQETRDQTGSGEDDVQYMV